MTTSAGFDQLILIELQCACRRKFAMEPPCGTDAAEKRKGRILPMAQEKQQPEKKPQAQYAKPELKKREKLAEVTEGEVVETGT